MNVVESAVSRKIPLVLVDGKGGSELGEKVKSLADRYGRPFYLFTMRGESWHYNPLARGGITELKDKLISLTEWTEEHYKKMAERYLQLVFRCFAAAGEKVDLVKVARYLDAIVKQIELIYKLLGMLIDRQEVEQTVKDKRDNDSIQKDIERLSALLDKEKDEETRLN